MAPDTWNGRRLLTTEELLAKVAQVKGIRQAHIYVEQPELGCGHCDDTGIAHVEDVAVWCDCPAGERAQRVAV
jgi:hypothetical protein